MSLCPLAVKVEAAQLHFEALLAIPSWLLSAQEGADHTAQLRLAMDDLEHLQRRLASQTARVELKIARP